MNVDGDGDGDDEDHAASMEPSFEAVLTSPISASGSPDRRDPSHVNISISSDEGDAIDVGIGIGVGVGVGVGSDVDADLSVSVLNSIDEESGISKDTNHPILNTNNATRPFSAPAQSGRKRSSGSLTSNHHSNSSSSGNSVIRPMTAFAMATNHNHSGHSLSSSSDHSSKFFSSDRSLSQSGYSSTSSSPRRSARKMLTDFIASDSSNRRCADCECILLDFTKMHCSFSTRVAFAAIQDQFQDRESGQEPLEKATFDFTDCHTKFKPPSPQPNGIEIELNQPPAAASSLSSTTNLNLNRNRHPSPKQYRDALSSIPHGVFVCAECISAHKALGTNITTVKSITMDQWSHNEVYTIMQAGGNGRSNTVLEAYLHNHEYKPDGNSNPEIREVFVRAKYQALAFVLPRGPLDSCRPLFSLSQLQNAGESSESKRRYGHDLNQSSSSSSSRLGHHVEEELPNRFMDYFCIISSNGLLEKESHSNLSSSRSPTDLGFQTEVSDCYPKQNSYGRKDFPQHISKFVFPEGCRPTKSQVPTLFTFTLTNELGKKLYGAALHIYETHMDLAKILEYIKQSDYQGSLPPWLQGFEHGGDRKKNLKSATLAEQDSDLLFLPKCLAVLSHYEFFDVWRKFLLRIYHISMVKAPLPLERYIANFVSEVPLPPQGKISVRLTVANNEIVSITRPPINRLPLVNFSYRPLFACLSVSNVMVVVASLLQESRVALFSRHCSLLGPCCEALSSLLFPLTWQGIYIPVLPSSLALDLLEAPIPFLVGTNRIYLDEFPINKRPKGVTLVDLDNDVIHLGFNEAGDRRLPPFLPEKVAGKLKEHLQKHAEVEFIVPDSNKKGGLTSGANNILFNELRPLYCRSTMAASTKKRAEILVQSDFAFMEDEHLMPIEFARGTLTDASVPNNNQFKMKGMKTKKSRKVSEDTVGLQKKHLLDIEGSNQAFNPSEIRDAFLRFMVSLLQDYDLYVSEKAQSEGQLPSFFKDKFLQTRGSDAKNFLSKLLDSQMFERFIFCRISEPDDPSIRFFHDSVQAKKNRSKKSVGRRKETKFISDQKYDVVETFTPPEPNSQGISDSVFVYNGFPDKLDPKFFGKVRKSDLAGAVKVGKRTRAPGSSYAKKNLALAQQVMADLLRPKSASPSKAYTERGPNWALHNIALQMSEQSKFHDTSSTDLLDTARTILDDTRLSQLRKVVSIMVFQKFWISHRIFLNYEMQQEQHHGNQVRSSWMRPVAITTHWSMLKTGIITFQSLYRSKKVSRMYKSTIALVTKLQSVIRGHQTRRKVLDLVTLRLSDYRLQIILLWDRAKVSLIYRSRFGLVDDLTTFLLHALLEKELQDLYDMLGIIHTSPSHEEDSFLAKSSTHCTFLSVQSQLSKSSVGESLFPAERENNSDRAIRILKGSTRIELERVQIYERVNTHPKQNDIFTKLNIGNNEKMKKLSVAKSVWTSNSLEPSANTILSIFPELLESPNIATVVPSKKAMTRFKIRKNAVLSPLDRTMQLEWKLDCIIRSDLGSITKGLLELSSRSRTYTVSSQNENKQNKIIMPSTMGLKEFVHYGTVQIKAS